MAFPRTQWYVNSVGYAAVAAFAAAHSYAAGNLIRQLTTPTVGNERVFVCIVAGTSGTEPSWTVTRGAKNTSTTPVFQECTGQAAVNGDIVNTVAWSNASIKNTALTLGTIIKNVAATHYFILSTAGTAGNGSEPSWGTTAGNTTADNTCTWTCIGAVGSFAGGAAPHARIPNALAANWSVGNDSIYVGDNSAEADTSTSTWTGQSTSSLTNYILCHNHSGSYPPTFSDLTTGATASYNAGILFNLVNVYMRGIGFVASTNGATFTFGNAAAALQRFDLCPVTLSGTSGFISIGNSSNLRGSKVIQDNCPFTFANAAMGVQLYGAEWEWRNTASAIAGGTQPTSLITAGKGARAWVHGVDLSASGSGKKLVAFGAGADGATVLFDRCKINASVTVATVAGLSGQVILSKCDSGAVNYRDEIYKSQATLTTEITIVRTGGASDGTTPVARKIVSGTDVIWALPFEAPPIAIWNETVGSAITITLYGIITAGAVPNNDDFWIDVEYFGSSATPISSLATSTKSGILASNAALSSDSSTWGGSTTAFKTSVTITPQMKGYITVTPKMAKTSATLYYDTKLDVV